MSRRKSVCVKWTLVLVVFAFCPLVFSRPQDTTTSAIISTENSIQTDKSTESTIRYKFRQQNITLDKLKLPTVTGFVNKSHIVDNRTINLDIDKKSTLRFNSYYNVETHKFPNRRNRMVSKTISNQNISESRKIKPIRKGDQTHTKKPESISIARKPLIRKVITKWTDKTKYEDLNFSEESSTSTEKDKVNFENSLSLEGYSSTENVVDQSAPVGKRPYFHYPNKLYNNQPSIETGDENLSVVHSNKVHIIEYPFPSVRPAYIFTTPRPTPIITNVGNPKPWSRPQHQINTNRKPTPKPVYKKPLKDKYSYHNNVNNYHPDGNFEVTTFQPSNAHTERIVIRPEEYSASNDECPTIYLTLNNTFQGQGKEACPDLNIAVNTNVVNKNVVVDSEEDDAEDLFPGGFGLGEDSESNEAAQGNDYFESEENQEEADSASVEPQGLSNYNADLQADSSEPGGVGGSHNHNAALSGHKPGRPHKDDDSFSMSSVISFFRPAINALTWLAAINPFSFTIISMMLTPLAILVAGYSGVAALFAPLGIGREASPKIVHVYRPHHGPKWEWDDKYKTWYLNDFPDSRRVRPANHRMAIERIPKNSKEEQTDVHVRPTLFYKMKEWMKDVTKRLKARGKNKMLNQIRKNKRKKRETWMRRIK